MKRKIAIGVVTFNPDDKLLVRLQNTIDKGFFIYIFDNSPENVLIRQFCRVNNSESLQYFTCGKNVGLGFGISSICSHAYYDSFPGLVFFDQDTIFDESALDFIENFYIHNQDIAKTYSAIVFNSKRIEFSEDSNQEKKFNYNDVLLAINSGSLYFLENLKKINWFNESYFVDCVDYEFCLNSSNNKLKIGECSNTPGFDHESDQGDIEYFLLGKVRRLRLYSAKRVFNSINASFRLILTSVITRNMPYFLAISRSLVGYVFWQFFVRIVVLFNLKKVI